MRRTAATGGLSAGYITGTVVLGLLVWLTSAPLRVTVSDTTASLIAVVILLVMLAGDVFAVLAKQMYPVGPRRQARKSLMYSWTGRHTVGFAWGFDAGLAVTTYRTTSGAWVLVTVIALDVASLWVIVAYPIGFVVGLLLLSLPSVGTSGDRGPDDLAIARVTGFSRHRRPTQVAYAIGLMAVIVALSST